VELPEFKALLRHFRHQATGCEVAHVYCDDPENLFAFVFRTPPVDSKGIPHILEHSVLCGSKRFPLKDPFVNLLGGSMNTFLNAFTFPDKTAYPAASTVPKDYTNIMQVYGDAVFQPLLEEEIFHQEGHHLEWDGKGRLKVVGVVYNEMKGSYTNPDALAMKWAIRSLFPDSSYRHDAGGEPQEIRNLTHRELVDYHSRYYHPSNCRIFLYGNLATENQLVFIQEQFLGQFRHRSVDSSIPLARGWDRPQKLQRSYSIKAGEPAANRCTVLLNWRLSPIDDPLLLLSLEVLTDILIGNAGSPLRKALVESRLGQDMAPASGLDAELRQMVFSVGLRGTETSMERKIQDLVFETLESLADDGIKPELIEGALHQAAIANREIRAGGMPYGLRLMRKSLRGWLHGLPPATTLEFERWMSQLRNRLEDPRYLPGLIRGHFLDNPTRTCLAVCPEEGKQEKEEARLEAELQELRCGFSDGDIRRIDDSLGRLRRFQEKGYGKEQSAEVPTLEIADLPQQVERIAWRQPASGDGPLFLFPMSSNGIVYVALAYDISAAPGGALMSLPFWCRAVRNCGLPGRPYGEVASELARKVGGFSISPDAVRTVAGTQKRFLFLRLKMLEENLPHALGLARELLAGADWSDRDRLRELLLSMRNGYRTSLLARGHLFASLRAGSKLAPALRSEEGWQGVSQYLFINEKAGRLDDVLDRIAADLETVRGLVLSAEPTLGATSDGEIIGTPEKILPGFFPYHPAAGSGRSVEEKNTYYSDAREESLMVSSPVAYVSLAVPTSYFGTDGNAREAVLARILSTGYLWEAIRMKGGAYGAFASLSELNGVFTFSTYRDPNVAASFGAFQESLKRTRDTPPDEGTVKRAVIATVGRDETPQGPGAKGFAGLYRRLSGVTDEMRQRRREAVLSTTPDGLAEAADQLLGSCSRGVSVAMAGKKAIQEAGSQMSGLLANALDIPL
jgi:Zn-dependent M16 (insulinase) family peptidase